MFTYKYLYIFQLIYSFFLSDNTDTPNEDKRINELYNGVAHSKELCIKQCNQIYKYI